MLPDQLPLVNFLKTHRPSLGVGRALSQNQHIAVLSNQLCLVAEEKGAQRNRQPLINRQSRHISRPRATVNKSEVCFDKNLIYLGCDVILSRIAKQSKQRAELRVISAEKRKLQVLSSEEAAEAKAETAAENAIKAAQKRAQREAQKGD